MFCLKSTDVFIEEFNQKESFRGQRHHVRVYITNNVLLLFGEMDAPRWVRFSNLEQSMQTLPARDDAPAAIIRRFRHEGIHPQRVR